MKHVPRLSVPQEKMHGRVFLTEEKICRSGVGWKERQNEMM
jgi:hypothetical protein